MANKLGPFLVAFRQIVSAVNRGLLDTVGGTGLGGDQGGINLRQDYAQCGAAVETADADIGRCAPVGKRFHFLDQRFQDPVGELASGSLAGEQQGKVGAVHSCRQRLWKRRRAGADRGSDATKQVVGGIPPQAAVDADQIGDAYQQESAAPRMLIVQSRPQLGDQVVAIGEARQRIKVGFAPHRFKPGRFFVEHEFEAFHGRIHGLGKLVQLGHIRFGNGDEAPVGDRHRLVDHRLQRAPQPP